jgi:hypothetical protein
MIPPAAMTGMPIFAVSRRTSASAEAGVAHVGIELTAMAARFDALCDDDIDPRRFDGAGLVEIGGGCHQQGPGRAQGFEPRGTR